MIAITAAWQLPRFVKTALVIIALAIALVAGSGLAGQTTASAATAGVDGCKKSFFGLVPWYQYMDKEFRLSKDPNKLNSKHPCTVKCFNFFSIPAGEPPNDCGQRKSDVPGVLLAIIDNMLRIAGLVAVAFIIIGAFQFVTSQGNAEQSAKARSTLINALLGLAMALFAIAFVSFLGNRIGG